MIKRNILDCMTLVGGTPLRFEGEKTYVSTGAVDCDHVDYAQTERVTYDNRPSRANLSVAEGDILFAKMCGTKKTLRIDRPLSEHLYSTGFCAVRANESLMDAALLYHLLASDQFLTQKDQNSSGATQKAITNAGLRKIVIQVPDLPEQRKLAANLDCMQRWIQCEEGINQYGLLAKHPTTQLPIASPYVNMGISFLKQANVLWLQIYQIVKDNCETPIGSSNPNDDLMERLLG